MSSQLESSRVTDTLGKMHIVDKQMALLGALYFYDKYQRRNVMSPDYVRSVPIYDPSDIMSIAKAGLAVLKEENQDRDGDSVRRISAALATHPRRTELFSALTDSQIEELCGAYEMTFCDVERVAVGPEQSTYRDRTAPEFAISATATVLSWMSAANPKTQLWFSGLGWMETEAVLKAIVLEKLPTGIGGLLDVGGAIEKQSDLPVDAQPLP